MRGLSLSQPYATLVACGEKRIETRSWRTGYRGPLAIHAAVGLEPVGGIRGLTALIESEPFATVLRPHLSGYTPEERAADLPRGVLVAVVELEDVVATERAVALMEAWDPLAAERETAFGNYTPGRYAWLLKHRLNLYDGIVCRGALGLWNLPKLARVELAEIGV